MGNGDVTMTLRKLEMDAIRADLAEIEELLRTSSEEEDPIGYRQFASRKQELNTQLAELAALNKHPHAELGIFFSGKPVFGSKGVVAEFAAKAVAAFQEVVAKRLASAELGNLGQRGPVPLKTSSELMLTDMARGSVGFILEETSPQASLTDTALSEALDQSVDLLADIGAAEEQTFENAAASLDSRQLTALQSLFATLDEYGATVRFVEHSKERWLDEAAVARGKARTEEMQIREQESTTITGKLLGLIPAHRRFELQLLDTGETIYGSVAADLAKTHTEQLMGKVEGRVWRTRMRIREIRRRNRAPKLSYTLLGLIEEVRKK